ncbi:endonuclease/exonuclease/phosphatase family protein [Allostreptomyces psammosilenae]|uniref:Endonuclease/exonuclease/phosphatase (EEP) superfamily protein YafD n=1 Tax=Allostreptomyces psammosilenae TaxID=1892865 RepID=A0A853A3N8_9ACTN|nr:endonuclease/exonuclease/phosphatase family protein [Allostreptomyces psammosilenae]NYI05098.1 endonuclease/exonuclease/phosphatase (EEP) superfamily protein YafD [Allostreptomyces psammosilenae]
MLLPSGPGRRLAAALAVVLLGGTTLPLLCRAFGWDDVTPWAQLLAFFPYLLVPAGLALLLAAVARWPVGVVWALLAAIGVGWLLVPAPGPATAEGAASPAPVATRLRILTANLLFGTATDALVDLLAGQRPDIVALQECDTACGERLQRPDLLAAYPHRLLRTAPGGEGSAILSRHPLRPAEDVPGLLAMPGAVATIAGQEVRVQVAHPMPPLPDGVGRWSAELGNVREFARRRAAEGGPTILAGDFNATRYHSGFRAILAEGGLFDAAETAGRHLTPTWHGPLGLGTPIDHVLLSEEFRVRAVSVTDLPGSDHRAVLAEVDFHPVD